MPYDFTSTSVPVQEVQQRVSNLVTKAISKSLPDGEKETWFFRSDTGTGKTTGFIQAIPDSSNSFAIAVPTMVDVDSVHDDLFSLGVDIFKWHSNSGTEKGDGKGYRVVVGNHAFMLSEKNDPARHIGNKDILIVDEVPSTARAKAVQQSDIVKAREFAEEYLSQELKDGFRSLEEWVQRRHGYAVDDGGNAAFHPISVKHSPALLSAENEIVEIPNEIAKRKLREVVEFLVAVSERRAFEWVMRGPKGHSMYYCWFSFPAYNFPKQIVFSATCQLDGLQFSPDGGKCSEMDLYISWSELEVDELHKIFPNSRCHPIHSKNPILQPKPKGVMVKVIDFLGDTDMEEVTYKDLEAIIKNPRQHAKKFKEAEFLLECNGWQFVQGGRGKHGTPSKFTRLNV